MTKNKEKHHFQEEPKTVAKEPDSQDAVKEAVPKSSAGQSAATATDLSADVKLEKAAAEIVQLNDQLLRLRADFDNYRKRALREQNAIYENANEALMLDLLPVLDHLQLAVGSVKEHQSDRAFQEGIHMILDQLMSILSKYGLVPFDAIKQPFDSNLHEAISYLPSETEPEGLVIAQSRQGYRFKNRLLRPAQVVVSSGKATKTDNQPAEEE